MDFMTRLLTQGSAVADEARDRAVLAATGRRRGTGWLGTAITAIGAGLAGAVAAMLLDPARGRARRARVLDQGGAALRRAGRELERTSRRIGSTLEGRMAAMRARSGESWEEPVNDATLTARLESELFRDPAVPKGSLNVSVEGGIAVLRGEVADDLMRRELVARAEQIEGVWSVRDLMHLPGEVAEARATVG